MNFTENITIAIYSIRTHLMRSLLTMLGVIIGVFSVITIITLGNGGRDYIVGMIRDMGQNTLFVYVDTTKVDATQYVTRADVAKVKALEGVKYVSPTNFVMGGVSGKRSNGFAMVFSGTPDLRYISSIDISYGRFFTEDEYNSAAPVCLISKNGAEDLFGRSDIVGETLDFSLNQQSVRLRIIGVADYNLMGSGSVSDMVSNSGMSASMGGSATVMMMPASTVDQMADSNGAYTGMSLIAVNDDELDAVGNAVLNLLYTNHDNRGSGVYTVQNMATYIDMADKIITLLTTFIAGVSAISLLVGGIGVMNIMLVSVTERTREIGIRKSLGAKTSALMVQFLTESVILCLIGGVIGLVLGVAASTAVALVMKIPIAIQFSTIAIAVGFSTAIGVFFGIYPAHRAAKMLPIEALRRED
ncbi:MAG: ABC transporter permease [Oscillospiraceae bacterium]|jgi:putative ABC transport system permease protein|nr:ABC transporter permease [Oscillospiraceae bacterium]